MAVGHLRGSIVLPLRSLLKLLKPWLWCKIDDSEVLNSARAYLINPFMQLDCLKCVVIRRRGAGRIQTGGCIATDVLRACLVRVLRQGVILLFGIPFDEVMLHSPGSFSPAL
jgi:hypothetical protein